jgi:hypothetical protein
MNTRHVILCVLLATPTAAADLAYDVHRVTTGLLGATRIAEVVMSGDHARMTFPGSTEPVRHEAAVELWLSGGSQRIVLDLRQQTYFDQARYAARVSKGQAQPELRLLGEPTGFAGSVSTANVRVELRTDPAPVEVSGFACTRATLNVSYDLRAVVGTQRVPATVKAVAEFYVTDTLPVKRLPFGHGAIALSTALEEPDRAISARLATLEGIALKKVVAVTRQVDGGPAVTEAVTETLQRFRDPVIPDGAFDVPAGYRYQEPLFVPPSRGARAPDALLLEKHSCEAR